MSQAVHGIFNLWKPRGWTSFDVVARVRRVTKQKRVGHTGTLDPDAVGVLPVCVGQATRLAEYLTEATKEYCAKIRLGTTTDTFDATGRVTSTGDFSAVTLDTVRGVLDRFRGQIYQTPPMFSAVKQEGRKLYEIARAGQTVERKPRLVEIYRLDLLGWEPPFLVLNVECSKGTYIRTLADDLGRGLGCGAILQSLIRLRTGPFVINDSLSLDELELAFSLDYWKKLIYPVDYIVLQWPAVVVGQEKEVAVVHGQPIRFAPQRAGCGTDRGAVDANSTTPAPAEGLELVRAYTADGRFLALLRGDRPTQSWQAHKVFLAASQPSDEDNGESEPMVR